MKAYLIDDESANSVVLSELLKEYFPHVTVSGAATSVPTALKEVKILNPDVIFLDVRMPDYSGFDFLDQLETTGAEIVFVTGYEEFALKAIKRDVADYLLKPIDVDELGAALERVERRLSQRQATDLSVEEIHLQVHRREKVMMISSAKIMWIEADGNYAILGLEDGEEYTISRTLKDMEIQLEQISSFIRIHRSLIVNLSHMISYSKTDPCVLKLKGGREFEISRRKKTEVLSRLEKANS